MNRYSSAFTSQNFDHAKLPEGPKLGILIVQLGTPDSPTAAALKRYLKEFLSDPRVVEIPALLWQIILRGIILNMRPAKSAKKYESIWIKNASQQGSPLFVYSQEQADLLKSELIKRGLQAQVRLAMRYGNPSVESVLQDMRAKGMDKLLVVPMYPQYAAATTASVFDKVFSTLSSWRDVPAIRTIKHFHDHDFYVDALAKSVRAHWQSKGRAEKLVMSFHGVPQRSLELGDPYHCECHKTGRLLAEKLGLDKSQYMVTFQSRFGKAKWLEPYTAPSLKALAKQGVGSVDVICPGFVVDCLETLEEIAMEASEEFIHAGGKTYNYIPCLNNSPNLTKGLATLVLDELGGWAVTNSQKQSAPTTSALYERQKAELDKLLLRRDA